MRVWNLGQAPTPATYTCPPDAAPMPGGLSPAAQAAYQVGPAYAADLNCMRDARGNTVCSDGRRYPPG